MVGRCQPGWPPCRWSSAGTSAPPPRRTGRSPRQPSPVSGRHRRRPARDGGEDRQMDPYPPYPSGLRLAGRRVVVVGGGHVAQRRVPACSRPGRSCRRLAARDPGDRGPGRAGEMRWERGPSPRTSTRRGTSSPRPRPRSTRRSERQPRSAAIFCVRSDDAPKATAWTPAVGRHAGVTVAVLATANRAGPLRSATRSSPGCATARSSARRLATRHPAWSSSAVARGTPTLVTVAAPRALAEADVVVADRLAPRELLDELPPDVELIDVAKLPRGRSAAQEDINQVIVERRSQASGWSGSRAATTTSSAAASRRASRVPRPAYR